MAEGGRALTGVAASLLLVGVAIAVSWRQRLGLERDLAIATVRALIQLAAVAAVIDLVFEHLGASGALLVVMVVIAAGSSSRRLAGVPGSLLLAAGSIASGSAVALALLFGLGVFPLDPRFVIPLGGMLIGNAMTATSVAGALVRDDVGSKLMEIESRLALGVRARRALEPVTRRAITRAMIPTIDSTRNAGLIFLPGTFVGMIVGGSSIGDAVRAQLIILFMLLGAVSIAAMVATVLTARAFVGRGERIIAPPP